MRFLVRSPPQLVLRNPLQKFAGDLGLMFEFTKHGVCDGHQCSFETSGLCLIARYASEVKQNAGIRTWINRAVETETPMPVNKATQVTMHSGHLGINTRRIAGKSH